VRRTKGIAAGAPVSEPEKPSGKNKKWQPIRIIIFYNLKLTHLVDKLFT